MLATGKHVWRKRWIFIAVGVAGIVGVGVLIGYAVRQSKANSYNATTNSSSASVTRVDNVSANKSSTFRRLHELPPVNSPAADELLARNDTPTWILNLYTYQRDSMQITPEVTAAFLQHLQKQLPVYFQKLGLDQPSASDQGLDLQPFIRVANDILTYLRFSRSTALLSLLREFASSSVVDYQSVDPDVLQAEVTTLLSEDSLDQFYTAVGQLAGGRSAAAAAAAGGRRSTSRRSLHAAGSRLGKLLGSSSSSSASHVSVLSEGSQGQQLRRLQAADGPTEAELTDQLLSQMLGKPAPAAKPSNAARSNGGLPGEGPAPGDASFSSTSTTSSSSSTVQSLQDMLCAAQSYTHSNLAGVLPGIACPTPRTQLYSDGSLVFQPVKIPLVLHCLRWLYKVPAQSFEGPPKEEYSGVMGMPQMNWGKDAAQAAAGNLVNVVNKYFKNTGISFELQEVRADPLTHTYLDLGSADAWLSCSHNAADAAAAAAGVACLRSIAALPDVAPLATQDFAINVIVSGTHYDNITFCTGGPCVNTSWGFNGAQGPWLQGLDDQLDQQWSEDNAADAFVWINFNMLDPYGLNRVEDWNTGGATLAAQLAEYLGLLPTHMGNPPCVNGVKGDGVPDTPPNQAILSYVTAASDLAGWCSEFRGSEQPAAAQLRPYVSCPGNEVDNVFNLLSTVPAGCKMILSPGQVSRMQWSVAKYRPNMMRMHAA